jgi:hypothetical protein
LCASLAAESLPTNLRQDESARHSRTATPKVERQMTAELPTVRIKALVAIEREREQLEKSRNSLEIQLNGRARVTGPVSRGPIDRRAVDGPARGGTMHDARFSAGAVLRREDDQDDRGDDPETDQKAADDVFAERR